MTKAMRLLVAGLQVTHRPRDSVFLTKIRGKSEKGSHVVFFVEASSIEDKVQSRSDKLKKIEETPENSKNPPPPCN